MQYLTGVCALAIPCVRDTVGKWNVTKDEFCNEKVFELRDSEDSPFKDYGIEKDKLVPYHEYTVYNVADHVRVYLDYLADRQFDILQGMFYDSIKSMDARRDIFKQAYGRLRYLACFHDVNNFMMEEFGNAWVSFVDSVESAASHVLNAASSYASNHTKDTPSDTPKSNPIKTKRVWSPVDVDSTGAEW